MHATTGSIPAPFHREERAPSSRYLAESIRYDLDDDERAGLARFFDEAAKATLLPPRLAPRPRSTRSCSARPTASASRPPTASDSSPRRRLFDLGLAADAVRKRKHPDGVVTYIVDRNVNYTNVCTTSCRFCAFYRPVGHPEGYVLSREELGKKLQEVVDAGGVQILLQGGLNPELRIGWYEDLVPLDQVRIQARPPRALARGDPPHRPARVA